MSLYFHPLSGPSASLPDPQTALDDGLLAFGGDLLPETLVKAYRKGVFPWYGEDEVIKWYCPKRRFVLIPGEEKVSRSMNKILKSNAFRVTIDRCFDEVINSCRTIDRKGQADTWITGPLQESFIQLHKEDYAHSVEVWQDERLVGGLYGLAIGKAFFGESMFSSVSNASKAGFLLLAKWLNSEGFHFIDCQIYTEYLASLGAKFVSGKTFESMLEVACNEPPVSTWQRRLL